MSVVHHIHRERREHPVDPRSPIRSEVLEDILRDAACFATEEEAPSGLAHRALARQIADQSAFRNVPPFRASRKQSIGLWLGGLSAGTLAGGVAAILVIAHLNGGAFRISPEVASLTTRTARQSETKPSPVSEIPSGTESLPGPHQPTVFAAASLAPVSQEKEVSSVDRLPVHHSLAREVPARFAAEDRPREQVSHAAPRQRSIANRAATTAKAHSTAPVARWKTEPFEETEYQLVTAAYTPEPASGGYASGHDHIQLTPLKMRASFDLSESDPMAGPSLPQY